MTTLKTRLILSYSLVVTATLAAAILIGFTMLRHQLITGTDFLLEKEFLEFQAKLANLAPPFQAQEIHDAVNPHALLDAALFFFQIHDESGQVLYRSPNLGRHSLPDLTRVEVPTTATVALPDWETLRIFESHHLGLHIQVATSLSNLNHIHTQLLVGLSVGLPIVLAVSVLVGYFLSQLTLRPLRTIQKAALRISADNMSERIPLPKGRDELAKLARLLNDMFGRLENAFNQIKQVTADTSHELRTPLSIIRLRVESALNNEDLPDSVRGDLEDVRIEVDHILRLMDQLMTLAKAESRVLPLNRVPRSTRHFIEHFQEDASVLSEARGRVFEVVVNEDVQATFDESWMRQVLFNLLSNSLKHAPENSTIRLTSRRDNGHWSVTFQDDGPGVPADQLDRIFRRFYQADGDRRPDGGCGLGLAVCKSIVELHGGRITGQNKKAESDGKQGFEVEFHIPLTTQAKDST